MGFEIFGTKHLGAQRPNNVQRFDPYCVSPACATTVKRKWGDGSRWVIRMNRLNGLWYIRPPDGVSARGAAFFTFETARAAFAAHSTHERNVPC
jgi:hypothetical protein